VHHLTFFTRQGDRSKIIGTLEHLPFYYYYLLIIININIYKSITYPPPNKLVTVFQCSTDPFFSPFFWNIVERRDTPSYPPASRKKVR
jgi:hypothetical protein